MTKYTKLVKKIDKEVWKAETRLHTKGREYAENTSFSSPDSYDYPHTFRSVLQVRQVLNDTWMKPRC